MPLRNGGGCSSQWARAATIPQPKAPGIQVWEERENISSMSFGKAAPNHNPPSFSQHQDVGSVPLLQRWRRAASTRALGAGLGDLLPAVSPGPRRPRPGQAKSAPRTALMGAEPRSQGVEASGNPALCDEAAGQETKLQARTRHTSLAVRPASPAGTSAVGASSVICWKPGFSQKPAEQIRFDCWPPRA